MRNAKAKGKVIGRPAVTADDIPNVFYKHFRKYKRGELNKKELSRICSLSYPTIYKYLKMVGNDICSKDGKRLLNVVAGEKNYKVPKEVKEISAHALWGNTAIETLHVRKAGVSGIYGLPNLKRVKMDKEYGDESLFLIIKHTPPIKRLNVPEDVRYVYIQAEDGDSEINHIYLYSKNLKGGDLRKASVKTTFHVRNKKVEKKLRKFGFKGKIVIEKNMK